MNSKEQASSKKNRAYLIYYANGDRRLADSAVTYDDALARIAARLAKPHNRGEQAEIWTMLSGEMCMVFHTTAD